MILSAGSWNLSIDRLRSIVKGSVYGLVRSVLSKWKSGKKPKNNRGGFILGSLFLELGTLQQIASASSSLNMACSSSMLTILRLCAMPCYCLERSSYLIPHHVYYQTLQNPVQIDLNVL
ncbi:hypothetical protein VNO77_22567 [Canavalia gladiata]|uniref:Uncharacterized protein n=1 Tax=Canavalia gladiata TaxID=3824 RepID=A0AAN9Q845_CANGL